MRINNERGLTLLELMIALVIAGLFMGLALPSLDRSLQESRMTTATNRLVSSLHYAREASLRVSVPVSLCPSQDGQHCVNDSNAWSDGWIIYRHQDSYGHRELRDPDQILQVVSTPVPGLRANRQIFTLRTDGRRSTNGTLLMCRPGEAKAARAVVISVMGRVRSTREHGEMPSAEC